MACPQFIVTEVGDLRFHGVLHASVSGGSDVGAAPVLNRATDATGHGSDAPQISFAMLRAKEEGLCLLPTLCLLVYRRRRSRRRGRRPGLSRPRA